MLLWWMLKQFQQPAHNGGLICLISSAFETLCLKELFSKPLPVVRNSDFMPSIYDALSEQVSNQYEQYKPSD